MSSENTVEYSVFQKGSITDNLNLLKTFISEHELKRDQIVAISINETKITDGDSAVLLVYRKQSNDPTATPFAQFQYKNYGVNSNWNGLQDLVNEDFKLDTQDVLSLQQCAKSVGNKKNQVLFFSPAQKVEDVYVSKQLFAPKETSWSAFAAEIVQWLNEFVAPHQLISITLTEDSHPVATKKIATIVHTGPVEDKKIPETEKPNFVLTVTEEKAGSTWDEALKNSVGAINKNGADGLHLTAVNSDADTKIVFTLSYDSNVAQLLKAQMRPTGCCTIF